MESNAGQMAEVVQLLIQSIYTAVTVLLLSTDILEQLCQAPGIPSTLTHQLVSYNCCTADTAGLAREMHAARWGTYSHLLGL